MELKRAGYRHVLDADVSGFFDHIPHQVIMQGLSHVVADGNVLRLVQRFLAAGVLEDGVVRSTTLGTPQGGVLSPLLANMALNFLDWHLHEHGYRFVRYADDFIVLCQTEHQAKEARQALAQGQTDDLRRASHTLKSTSATFGAMALSAAARELESLVREGMLDGADEQIARAEAEFARARTALEGMQDEP